MVALSRFISSLPNSRDAISSLLPSMMPIYCVNGATVVKFEDSLRLGRRIEHSTNLLSVARKLANCLPCCEDRKRDWGAQEHRNHAVQAAGSRIE